MAANGRIKCLTSAVAAGRAAEGLSAIIGSGRGWRLRFAAPEFVGRSQVNLRIDRNRKQQNSTFVLSAEFRREDDEFVIAWTMHVVAIFT